MALLSSLGWSKEVPSVQELAREPLDAVPLRYVRQVAEDERCNPSLQVPMVNMTRLINAESRQEELQKIRTACSEWGAFQLVNHGVSDELVKEMKKQTREFYDLPLEEKIRYSHKEGSLEGYGQAFVESREQQWSDMMFVNALPVEDRDVSFWPENPKGFSETIDRYSKEMRRLAVSVLDFMGMAVGLEAREFSEVCEDGKLEVRMNLYPPCPQPERVIGCSPHTDFTSITLLLEYDETPGLQVRKDGFWATVKPAPGAILILMGHIIEVMSNGIYKAPEHRAVANNSKERISILCFCYAGKVATIGPAHDLIKPESPAIYKSVSQPEYFRRFYSRKVDGVRFIDTLKIEGFP